MSFVIHHGGGDGTYKSFSVIQNHAIPQLQKGRHVISSIRGFDSIRVIESVLGVDIPPESKITYIDIDTVDGRKKMSRWWEWVPYGAYVIIDEAQLIFPKGRKVDYYDYPSKEYTNESTGEVHLLSSEESAEKDDRPCGLIHAITQHRHWNWDVALITPNINFLIPDIKQMTRTAYAHRKMGDLIPWRPNGWREIKHHADESWKQSVNPPIQYNADKRIFKVYKSSKTGKHEDGGAESSLFKNPKIMGSLSVAFIGISLFIYILFNYIFSDGGTLDMSKDSDSSFQVSNSPDPDYGSPGNNPQASNVQSVQYDTVVTTSFDTSSISIVGNLAGDMLFEFGKGEKSYQLSSRVLIKSGYDVVMKSECLAFINTQSVSYRVTCPLHRRYFKSKPQRNSIRLNTNPFQSASSEQGGSDGERTTASL